MKNKLTPEQRQEMFDLYLAGGRDAVGHLADRYEMSLEYVGKLAVANGYARNEVNRWTPEEVELAKKLFAENAPESAFKAQIGRTRTACRNKVTKAAGDKTAKISAPPVPSYVLEDRTRRLLAPRSLTAVLMGDPPRGFSALEQRA